MSRDIWDPWNVILCAAITAVAASFFHPPAAPLFALLALAVLAFQLSGNSG